MAAWARPGRTVNQKLWSKFGPMKINDSMNAEDYLQKGTDMQEDRTWANEAENQAWLEAMPSSVQERILDVWYQFVWKSSFRGLRRKQSLSPSVSISCCHYNDQIL